MKLLIFVFCEAGGCVCVCVCVYAVMLYVLLMYLQIYQIESDEGMKPKKPSEVDRVFKQALKEFKDNLVATYSVMSKQGAEGLNVKYKDLIANFLHVSYDSVLIVCYIIIFRSLLLVLFKESSKCMVWSYMFIPVSYFV